MIGPIIIEWHGPYWRVMDLGYEPIADRIIAEVYSRWVALLIAFLARRGWA
jgi:hypothetical protein